MTVTLVGGYFNHYGQYAAVFLAGLGRAHEPLPRRARAPQERCQEREVLPLESTGGRAFKGLCRSAPMPCFVLKQADSYDN
jgi:hypothetical protein